MKKTPAPLTPTDGELEAIERALGYTFRDRTLLRQAFTRRSYTEEYKAKNKRPAPVECNEVPETLGDSVLSAALLTILFRRHGKVTERGYEADFDEGVFTEIKKNLCDKTALSRIIDGLKTADGTPFAKVADCRYELAIVSRDFFGNPAGELELTKLSEGEAHAEAVQLREEKIAELHKQAKELH